MKINCLQTNPGLSLEKNMSELESMLASLMLEPGQANVAVLPEVFAVMGSDELRRSSANNLGDGVFRTLSGWAKRTGQYLVAGTHGEISQQPGKVYNTATVFSAQGALMDVYRKIHLFNLKDANGTPLYCESDVFAEGQESSTFWIESGTEKWHCMTIVCYDLRFPEIVRREISRSGPLDVLFVPAAFTHQTGKDHWEVLLRARAIENQCYVVACNQTGFHTEGRKRNWGHSMVVDPWGQLVNQLGEEVGVLQTTLSKEIIQSARVRLPALQDRVFKS
ncbi:MAG: carbon-nitrogen hydrolase family protein [Betaproteobacteria bacterium]|nr:carbon-nitrogen hydrolase family protein [Betaproteobacteria bacterium]